VKSTARAPGSSSCRGVGPSPEEEGASPTGRIAVSPAARAIKSTSATALNSLPSDHAPVVIDLDEPGHPFDPGWSGALERIAARTKPRSRR